MSVVQESSFRDPNRAGEVLCIQAEHAALPDDEVIDIGAPLTDRNVVECEPSIRR